MTPVRSASDLVALHASLRARAFDAVGPKLATTLACGCGGAPAAEAEGGDEDKPKDKESGRAEQR